jgi:hypothetical protein
MTGLEFAAVALIGVLVGRFLPNRRKGPKPAKPPEPICGCTHHYSYHDPQTGECGAGVRVPSRYNDYGAVTAWKTAECACLQYSGPQPLPEYFVPEVTTGE